MLFLFHSFGFRKFQQTETKKKNEKQKKTCQKGQKYDKIPFLFILPTFFKKGTILSCATLCKIKGALVRLARAALRVDVKTPTNKNGPQTLQVFKINLLSNNSALETETPNKNAMSKYIAPV